MEADRFDALVRSLTFSDSRRRALAALGGALGLLAWPDEQDTWAAKSGKCKPACGECETCRKGKCKKKRGKKRCKRGTCLPRPNGTACSGAGICQRGVCTCPTGLTRCGATCVDTTTDPRNCGTCGTRCQINAACTAGVCDCVPTGCGLLPNAICCGVGGCATCSAVNFIDTRDCAIGTSCRPDTTPCIGPSCRACCQAGSTCDPDTGTCVH